MVIEENKSKQAFIDIIKRIINTHGTFSCADVEAESSPVIASLGSRTHQLAESFYENKVEVITYVDENESGVDFILYEDLDVDTLIEIHKLALRWEDENE